MAEVNLAVGRGPSGFNKLVVLKSMRKHLVADPDLRQMFLAEARLSARLNHGNVVHVYEVLDTSLPCIVMEYLEGQSMAAILEAGRERFTTPMQLRVISEALAGLHYSHQLRDYDGTPLNIVHRDVSPQNVFVTYDGVVKVLDFGIAKVANVPGQTRTGMIKGKISYMPREQLLGEDLDRRADVYAVGCMLWQAATGVKLWSWMSERDLMHCLIDGNIPRPSDHAAVAPELEQIVMKALAPDPESRYATALELQEAIDHYLGDTNGCTMREVAAFVSELFAEHRESRSKTIHTSLSAPSSIPPAADANGVETTVEGLDPRMTVRRHRRDFRLLSGLALLLLLGGTAYFATSRMAGRPGSAQVPSAQARLVQVRISVTPREAAVTVDGQPVKSNPAVLEVPPDSVDHEIRATLAGHVPIVRTVRFERDLAMDLSLETMATEPVGSAAPERSSALPKRRNLAAAPAHNAPRPRTEGSTRATNPSACDPPFRYENGIKVYNPGCF